MDWAKAKSILIILFLGLNIFLAINLIGFYNENDVDRKNLIQAQSILSDRGYLLKCGIPGDTKSKRINFENGGYDKDEVVRKLMGISGLTPGQLEDSREISKDSRKLRFENGNVLIYNNTNPSGNINISDAKKVERYAQEFLKGLQLPISQYQLDTQATNEDGSLTLLFKGKYGGYLIFYNEAELTVTTKGITYLRYRFVEPNNLEPSENKIVPAYKILLKYFIEGRGEEITGIDLGFECSFRENKIQSSEGPVWRVVIKGGKTRYFRASDAEEIFFENA